MPSSTSASRPLARCSGPTGSPTVITPTADRIALAAFFHDVGIWTDRTFDYLAPSEAAARRYLLDVGRDGQADEIGEMIRLHHKLTPAPAGLVEAFRRADLADLSLGLIRSGLPRTFVREVRSAFPNAGFHRRLLALGAARLRSHPLHPLPMLRW
jgi:hypothetical protein